MEAWRSGSLSESRTLRTDCVTQTRNHSRNSHRCSIPQNCTFGLGAGGWGARGLHGPALGSAAQKPAQPSKEACGEAAPQKKHFATLPINVFLRAEVSGLRGSFHAIRSKCLLRAARKQSACLKTAKGEPSSTLRAPAVSFVRPNLSIFVYLQCIRHNSQIASRFFRPPGPPTCVPLEHLYIQVLGWPRYKVCDKSRMDSRQDAKGPIGKKRLFRPAPVACLSNGRNS